MQTAKKIDYIKISRESCFIQEDTQYVEITELEEADVSI